AHAQGIVHRDLKPHNLMVETTGRCWILDFGLAKAADESTDAASAPASHATGPLTISGVMGTPQYMAPEQWHSKADARTDIWGLGATLYELLVLTPAFPGDS